MKFKVHWIIDGIAEIEGESKEDAEKKLQESLEEYVKNSEDLMNKFTLALVLAKIAPTKDYSRQAIKLSESVIKLGLTDEEMAEIATIDKNCRLIKGQVFLWEEASGWEVLWDLDGTIEQ